MDSSIVATDASSNCVVCNELFDTDNTGRFNGSGVIVIPCRHYLHYDCLLPWWQTFNDGSLNCPDSGCRKPIFKRAVHISEPANPPARRHTQVPVCRDLSVSDQVAGQPSSLRKSIKWLHCHNPIVDVYSDGVRDLFERGGSFTNPLDSSVMNDCGWAGCAGCALCAYIAGGSVVTIGLSGIFGYLTGRLEGHLCYLDLRSELIGQESAGESPVTRQTGAMVRQQPAVLTDQPPSYAVTMLGRGSEQHSPASGLPPTGSLPVRRCR